MFIYVLHSTLYTITKEANYDQIKFPNIKN